MKYLYVSMLLLFCCTTFSQTGKITYNSVLNLGAGLNKSSNALYFTQQASLYTRDIENFVQKGNTVKSEQAGNEKITEIHLSVDSDPIGNQIYYGLKSRTLTCRGSLSDGLKLKFYIYEDKGAGKIAWQLQDEFKTISGYNCQKATADFRGRSYEAWFAPKLPLPYGPWKFVGLPGLILEVYDLKREVYFAADQIKIPFNEAKEIVKKTDDVEKISHNEYIEKRNHTSPNLSKAIMARLPKGATLDSFEKKVYAIELEYGWEKE